MFLKSLVEFGLTRRLTVILGLAAFILLGAFSFARLNIEAYPNPAPVILEISAQAPGLSAEEMEKYYTVPMEMSLYSTPHGAPRRRVSPMEEDSTQRVVD